MVESQIPWANGDLGWKFCPEIRSSVKAPVSSTLHSFFHSPCQATQHVAVRKEWKTFSILCLRSWQQNAKTFPSNKFLRNCQKNLTKLPGQSRCHRHYSEKEKGRDSELPVLEISRRKTEVHPQNKKQRRHQAFNRDLQRIYNRFRSSHDSPIICPFPRETGTRGSPAGDDVQRVSPGRKLRFVRRWRHRHVWPPL